MDSDVHSKPVKIIAFAFSRVCRNMLNEIISRSQAGTLGSNFNLGSSGLIAGGMGGMGDGAEKSLEISIPPDKCGLIIGKGGETIKMVSN